LGGGAADGIRLEVMGRMENIAGIRQPIAYATMIP